MLKLKKWPGIIPIMILLYFPLKHYQSQFEVESFNTYLTVFYIGFMIFIILTTAINNDNILSQFNNLKLFYLYIIFTMIIFIILSFFSINISSSVKNSLFAIVNLGLMFTCFYFVQYFYLKNINWRQCFEVISILFLLSLLIGQFIIEDWAPIRNIRMAVGINPNVLSYLGLFFLIQAHINALINNKWSMKQKIMWILALIVIFWTISRTTIFTFTFIYAFYALYLWWNNLKKNKNFKISFVLKNIIKVFITVFLGYILLKYIRNTEFYNDLVFRLSNADNVSSRTDTWKFLLASFKNSPLVGGYGWGGTREALIYVDILADSSHNLFVRLLAETGIIGLITIIALPISIVFYIFISRNKLEEIFKNPLGMFILIVIIGVFFVLQMFEDRYLYGVFRNTTDITIWFLSFGLIIVNYANEIFKNNDI